jgi:hypothetical protein
VRYVKQFGLFCLDFVVGDDWRLAAGVVTSIGVVFVLAHHGRNLWWLLPVVLVGALALSVAAVARSARTPDRKDQAVRAAPESTVET